MKPITTKDGSITFHNQKFDETYHSTSGAEQEAIKKFVEPCKINSFTNNISILDICFGLGYNTAAALDVINPSCNVFIIGLENDTEILNKISSITTNFRNYDIIKKLVKNNYYYNEKNTKIKILVGNAIQTIKTINHKFDAIFLDPFSPKKNPELWTVSFFKDIKKLMKPKATLATYSCARIVKTNLKNAGFIREDGPCIGRRSPSTLAKIS